MVRLVKLTNKQCIVLVQVRWPPIRKFNFKILIVLKTNYLNKIKYNW